MQCDSVDVFGAAGINGIGRESAYKVYDNAAYTELSSDVNGTALVSLSLIVACFFI